MKNGDAKKSETLEVRVSYETKRELSERAKSEGRTVSDVVRHLIGSYLALPVSKAHNSKLGDAIMLIKKLLTTKPKTAIAAMAALILSPLMIIPSATAESLILDIAGEHIQPVEKDGVRKRTFETQVELETGATVTMGFDGNLVSTDPDFVHNSNWLSLKVNNVDIVKGKKNVSMTVSIYHKVQGEDTMVAEPIIKAIYGESAEFKMVTDYNDETNTVYEKGQMKEISLKVTPRAKS